MATVYAFMNSKGGVGKTTLAANIGYEIADIAKTDVLLVDTDPQCNLTQIFYDAERLDSIHASRTVFAAFRTDGSQGPDPFPADLRVRVSPRGATTHVDLVPGSFETLKFGVIAGPAMARAILGNFKDFIEKAREQYRYVILDTNPCSTFTTVCSLAVADYVVAPVTLDTFSVRGIELIRDVMSDMYPDLEWLRKESERLKIIFNRIPRTGDAKKLNKIYEQEQLIRRTFPSLSPSIMPDRIHHTTLLFNEEPGLGFALSRPRWGFGRRARNELKTDLHNAATDLLATANGKA